MKNMFLKLSGILQKIFGISAVILLFVGGLCYFGYIAALIMGGATAEMMSTFIYSDIFKVLIYAASIPTIIGLLSIYFKKEKFLTFSDK